jgi:hypothetical protein
VEPGDLNVVVRSMSNVVRWRTAVRVAAMMLALAGEGSNSGAFCYDPNGISNHRAQKRARDLCPFKKDLDPIKQGLRLEDPMTRTSLNQNGRERPLKGQSALKFL